MCATSGRWPIGSWAGYAGWLPAAASCCWATRDELIVPAKASSSAGAISCRRAASSRIGIAARRPSGRSCQSDRSAGFVGEPVSEHLLRCVMFLVEPRLDCVDRLAGVPEIIGRQLCGSTDLLCDHCLGFTPKAGTILQDTLDFRPRFADRHPPACARLRRRRGFELQQVPQDPGNLRTQFAPVRLPQALDLLGKVLPIERQIGTFGAPQRGRLLFRPTDEVLVVWRAQLRRTLMSSTK